MEGLGEAATGTISAGVWNTKILCTLDLLTKTLAGGALAKTYSLLLSNPEAA